MSDIKKKLFPKLNKKIRWFLTDESWKITKKDAIWLAAWTVLLSGLNSAFAATTHASWSQSDWAWWSTTYNYNIDYTPWAAQCTASHSSAVTNWHFSWTPSATLNSDLWTVNTVVWHSSHWSHWSHWSHSSHWSHWSHWNHWSW